VYHWGCLGKRGDSAAKRPVGRFIRTKHFSNVPRNREGVEGRTSPEDEAGNGARRTGSTEESSRRAATSGDEYPPPKSGKEGQTRQRLKVSATTR